MDPSQLNSINVPQTGSQNPATVFKAAGIPMRVVVANIGANLIFLAHDPATLSNTPVFTNTYQLRPDKEVIIVLAPGQGLFAVALGANGTASIAISDALPLAASS